MSRFVYPYGVILREGSRVEVFPAVELYVNGRKGRRIKSIFHLDSGATTSILPAADTQELGIDLLSGKRMLVRGFSGEELAGYQHFLKVEFNGVGFQTSFIFVEPMVPRILGRDGIFSKFGVLFDELKHRTLFLDIKKEKL